jgi:hypothetical protein
VVAQQAKDTFVMEIDGIPHGVTKGAVFSDSDPLVRHDAANGGLLFAPLDLGDEKPPPPKSKADAPKAEPVKAEPKAAGRKS